MKTTKNLTQQLKAYLKNIGYLLTYRKGDCDGYYNFRTNDHLLIPFDDKAVLDTSDIQEIFKNSEAIDLPPQLELNQFELFIYNQKTKQYEN